VRRLSSSPRPPQGMELFLDCGHYFSSTLFPPTDRPCPKKRPFSPLGNFFLGSPFFFLISPKSAYIFPPLRAVRFRRADFVMTADPRQSAFPVVLESHEAAWSNASSSAPPWFSPPRADPLLNRERRSSSLSPPDLHPLYPECYITPLNQLGQLP